MKLSVISPIYNEEGNVAELFRQIEESVTHLVAVGKITEYEIIFVNDGSRDNSLQIMQTLSPLKIINFRRNFGQTAGLDAGIKAAKGDVIILLDSDLQNDPADFEKLLDKMFEGAGYDIVSGWRKYRKDTASKKFISRGARFLRSFLVEDGIHDSGCTLKAYKRECFENVDLQGEMHRFIVAILRWQGFTVAEIVVNHRARTSGKTKYNMWRTLRGLVDMISIWFWRKYSSRPLHIFGTAGLVMLFLSAVTIAISFLDKYFLGIKPSNTVLFFMAIFFGMSGVVLFTSGILADILVKTYYRTMNMRPYSIKDVAEV